MNFVYIYIYSVDDKFVGENDRGRKRACVTYCITYILSCMTKHSPQYKVLLLGRILGGVATSLLFSAFESWLVAEHNRVRRELYTVIILKIDTNAGFLFAERV